MYMYMYMYAVCYQVVQQISVELGRESKLMVNQPWTTEHHGYTSVVKGTLQDVRVNSSLDYKVLGSGATVDVS